METLQHTKYSRDSVIEQGNGHSFAKIRLWRMQRPYVQDAADAYLNKEMSWTIADTHTAISADPSCTHFSILEFSMSYI